MSLMPCRTLIFNGSSKKVYGDSIMPEAGHRHLDFELTDEVSVFDRGPIRCKFNRLGQLRASISVLIFRYLEEAGIRTLFVEQMSPTRIKVRACSVPEKGLKAEGNLRLLPVEVLVRRKASKKFVDRVLRNEVADAHVKLSMYQSFYAGMAFNPAFVECSTKHEAKDRYLSDAEAMRLCALSLAQLQELYLLARKVGECIASVLSKSSIDLGDFKLEVGFDDRTGEFFVTDSISPDEMGLSDVKGNQYDKNPLRNWYIETFPEWYADLLKAKDLHPLNANMWPKYPRKLPPMKLRKKMVSSYMRVLDAVSG